MQWRLDADPKCLTPAFFALSDLCRAEAMTPIDGFLSFLNLFVPLYMTAFVLIIALVFMPNVNATNQEIESKRKMLLYLPVAIVSRVASIRQLVDDILQQRSNTHDRARARRGGGSAG